MGGLWSRVYETSKTCAPGGWDLLGMGVGMEVFADTIAVSAIWRRPWGAPDLSRLESVGAVRAGRAE